ncbi:hypothetical protein PS627_01284 [Pseudomonas fluorescens]|nr:hypothetical protein PS627_01284 [Pseudomonas fluorescens]
MGLSSVLGGYEDLVEARKVLHPRLPDASKH